MYYRYKENKIMQCPKEIKGDGRFVVNDNICSALSTKDSNELKRHDIDGKKYKYVIFVFTIGKFSNYLERVKKIKLNKNENAFKNEKTVIIYPFRVYIFNFVICTMGFSSLREPKGI